MKLKLIYGLISLQALTLVSFGSFELLSIIRGDTPYHHLLLVLIPIIFFVSGIIELYLILDLEINRLLLKASPFVILVIISSVFFLETTLDQQTFKTIILGAELIGLLLLATELKKLKNATQQNLRKHGEKRTEGRQ